MKKIKVQTPEEIFLVSGLIEKVPELVEWMMEPKGMSIKLPISIEQGNYTLTIALDVDSHDIS